MRDDENAAGPRALTEWEAKASKKLRKVTGMKLSQAQMVIRKQAAVRINSENCACVHLSFIFCASDTRLLTNNETNTLRDEFACLCDECCSAEAE